MSKNTITPEDLEQHRLWNVTDGKDGKRIERSGAYLTGANLARANLARANLADAYLADAYLAGANLAGANLAGANLAGANLARANLAGANLAGANLARANLAGANLTSEIKLNGIAPLIALNFNHEWPLFLWNTDQGVVVQCGCRGPWPIGQMRKHWQQHEASQRRDVVLPAMYALLKIAKAQGWSIGDSDHDSPSENTEIAVGALSLPS